MSSCCVCDGCGCRHGFYTRMMKQDAPQDLLEDGDEDKDLHIDASKRRIEVPPRAVALPRLRSIRAVYR